MPTYEYRCGACGQQQDIVQKMSDPTLVVCPLCGAPQLERLISASAFALRGGGWYADGYGGGKSDSDAKPSASGKAESSPVKAETAADSGAKTEPAAAPAAAAPAPAKPGGE